MKTYRITVNGSVYDVAVEETTGTYMPVMQAPMAAMPAPMAAMPAPVAAMPAPVAPAPVPAPVAQVAAPVATPAPAPVAAPAPAAAPAAGGSQEGSIKVTAPMPGAIWDIKVAVGDRIQKNQVVVILEAMKMENEIVAEEEGTVVGIHVSTGATVTPGQLLVSMSK